MAFFLNVIKKMKKFIDDFLKFTEMSKSVYHTVAQIEKELLLKNYVELKLEKKWSIKEGSNYFIKRNDSTLIAFSIPKNLKTLFFKISANHTDSPGLKLKSNPEIINEKKFLRLNSEVYGSPILNTWLDRPLSIAGRAFIRTENILAPISKLVDIDKNLMIIPNLAIHQNKEVNSVVKLSVQNDMLPLISLVEDTFNSKDYLINILCKENKIKKSDILDVELFVYDRVAGTTIGMEEKIINASKIDNLASTFSGLKALLESKGKDGINILACFDNEEIGSRSKQGADSNLLLNILERLSLGLNYTREEFFTSLYNSFFISVDGAHSVHPNYGGKSDPTNRPYINGGVVIKHSSNLSYSTDAFSSSVIKELALNNKIKVQEFYNHSDERGGGTLGPINSTHLDINSVDIGIPILGMHSIKESSGTEDIFSLKNLLKAFYSL